MDIASFAQLFRTFRRSAFRLETLSHYSVLEETEEFQRFLRGEPLPKEKNADWTGLVSSAVAAGKSLERVHLLPSVLSPYLRFELEWAYPFSAHAGESIRLLTEAAPAAIRAMASEDFWMFDDELVIRMRYDSEGRFLAPEVVQRADDIDRYRQTVARIMPYTTTFSEYMASIRSL